MRSVLRLSGPEALSLSGLPESILPGVRSHRISGVPGEAWIFRAPHSYTAEDVVELHLPGSPPLVDAVLQEVLHRGGRLALPGEFTHRAFLHGRLGLAEAEAVLHLVSAGREAEARAAVRYGEFSRRTADIESQVLNLCAEVEAAIDFTDQEIEILPSQVAKRRLGETGAALETLLRDSGSRRLPGTRPVAMLFGPPNAGKSSLFNRLCGATAIVSERAGTTRDMLRGEMEDVDLLDTAGWMEGAGGVDAQAVNKTEEVLEQADLVVFVADASDPSPARGVAERAARHPCLAVWNKCDIAAPEGGPLIREWVRVSARTGEGLSVLKDRIRQMLLSTPGGGAEARFQVSLRQRAQLRRAHGALMRAQRALESGTGWECVAADLRETAESLGGVTGRVVTEEILDRIFSQFCLGK